jgi:hypothetical protein
MDIKRVLVQGYQVQTIQNSVHLTLFISYGSREVSWRFTKEEVSALLARGGVWRDGHQEHINLARGITVLNSKANYTEIWNLTERDYESLRYDLEEALGQST